MQREEVTYKAIFSCGSAHERDGDVPQRQPSGTLCTLVPAPSQVILSLIAISVGAL